MMGAINNRRVCTCAVCGAEFVGTKRSKYCSPKCRAEGNAAKSEEWRKSHPDYDRNKARNIRAAKKRSDRKAGVSMGRMTEDEHRRAEFERDTAKYMHDPEYRRIVEDSIRRREVNDRRNASLARKFRADKSRYENSAETPGMMFPIGPFSQTFH